MLARLRHGPAPAAGTAGEASCARSAPAGSRIRSPPERLAGVLHPVGLSAGARLTFWGRNLLESGDFLTTFVDATALGQMVASCGRVLGARDTRARRGAERHVRNGISKRDEHQCRPGARSRSVETPAGLPQHLAPGDGPPSLRRQFAW